MKRYFAFVCVLMLVTGCQSPKDRYLAEKCRSSLSFSGLVSGEAEACYARESTKLQCKDYGFVEGSADFSKCLMTVDSERKVRRQISNEAERTRSMMLMNQK